MAGKKLIGVFLVGIVVLQLVIEATDGFYFGASGRLECSSDGGQRSCNNCKFTCRCTGDGTSTYYRVSARYRRGRCQPKSRAPLNCDRFRWCATCRTNLPERDYHGCKRYLPGAPRHH